MTLLQQALEALEAGLDCAQEVAHRTHEELKGYKPHRHAAVDADVANIETAITALREAIAQGAVVVPAERINSRDIMAASLVLPADLSRATGRVLAGPEPAEGLELVKWWARAKARLRYIEVDAMLEERDK